MLRNKELGLTVFLAILFFVLLFLNLAPSIATPITGDTSNIVIENNTIYLDSLTLKQKIAQMVVAAGIEENKEELQAMNIGGIYLGARENASSFRETVNSFQAGSRVPFLVSADVEGCNNPFQAFQEFPALKEINSSHQAYQVGAEEGKLMKELGFTINFSPVVESQDELWDCRAFQGSIPEITEKAVNYIQGIQSQGIMATSKHYPGKTLIKKDPHKHVVQIRIEYQDLIPFQASMENNVSALMISHVIATGAVDSESKPCDASKRIGESLGGYQGLVISDEIRMLGIQDYYQEEEHMFVDLVKAGNDLILYFDPEVENLQHFIDVIEKAVEEGTISEERINRSVKKILEAKGFKVMD